MSSLPFLGDRRVGVEFPECSSSRNCVSMRSLLGEVGSSLRGRPRPRFTGEIPLRCCSCLRGDCEVCLFTGEGDLSRVFARDGLEEATTISSSSSCRGMWFFGMVKGVKKSVMLLCFFDMVARH
jgi:hypothetical protein